MTPEEKVCSARLQINSMAVEIAESFVINDAAAEPVEARLGIAIGRCLCALRSQISFDAQEVLKHASTWVQVMATGGWQELAEEAEKAATLE